MTRVSRRSPINVAVVANTLGDSTMSRGIAAHVSLLFAVCLGYWTQIRLAFIPHDLSIAHAR